MFEKFKRYLQQQFRYVVIQNETLATRLSFTFSNLQFWLVIFLSLFTGFIFVSSLYFYTPLKYQIPGYLDPELQKKQKELLAQLNDMKLTVARQDSFIQSIQRMSGYTKPDSIKKQEAREDHEEEEGDSENRFLPKEYIEKIDQATQKQSLQSELGQIQAGSMKISDQIIVLLPPINGILVEKFDGLRGHLGIDLAAKENELVKSVAGGFVIFSEYSLENGWTIGIAHKNGVVSFYKHNSKVFKKVGSSVYAGESIAVVGNSGENTSGPHLHFEIWINGLPANPLDYLKYSEK